MKDILPKRVKFDWLGYIHNNNYDADFKVFCKGKKIRNRNRLGYMFVKHIKGRDFCILVRSVNNMMKKGLPWPDYLDEVIRIAKTPWMSED